jgi:hypothetical protein
MRTLAEALTAVSDIAIDAAAEPNSRVINESVAAGVSFELCAAIAGTLRANSVRELNVSFSWRDDCPRVMSQNAHWFFRKRLATGSRR